MPTPTFWTALRGVAVLGALTAPAALLAVHFPAVAMCSGDAALLAYSLLRHRSADDGRRTRFHRHRSLRNAIRAMFAAGAAVGGVTALAAPASWTGLHAAVGRGLVGVGVGAASALVGFFLIMVSMLIAAEREVRDRAGGRR